MFLWLTNIEQGITYKIIVGDEEVGETISSHTEEVYNLNEVIGDNIRKLLPEFTGKKITAVSQTINVWTGTDKRTLEIQLEFVAKDSAFDDVFCPIRDIQSWSTPSMGEYAKAIEGPVSKRNVGYLNMAAPADISVKVGDLIQIPFVWIKRGMITTCKPSWKPPFDKFGYPLHAELQLTIEDLEVQQASNYIVNNKWKEKHQKGVAVDKANFVITNQNQGNQAKQPRQMDLKRYLKEKLSKRYVKGRQSVLGTTWRKAVSDQIFKR